MKNFSPIILILIVLISFFAGFRANQHLTAKKLNKIQLMVSKQQEFIKKYASSIDRECN